MIKKISLCAVSFLVAACATVNIDEKYPSFVTVGENPTMVGFSENKIQIGEDVEKNHQRDCLLVLNIAEVALQFLPQNYDVDFTRCDHFGNQLFVENIGEHFEYTIFFERITQKYFLLEQGNLLRELQVVP